jgi:hydroxymethylpyrimidine/phosphomethylpyrimidine kinase
MKGRVLIIAGSDSGGGAGIQADIKTVSALGSYAMTAITAITVQDTHKVHDVHPIPPAIAAAQMRVVLDDIGADALKTGMLHDALLIESIAAVLREKTRGIPLVVDPVMLAKGGDALLRQDAVKALQEQLFPLARLITPNAPEAEVLTGRSVKSLAEMEAALPFLAEKTPAAILLKGGHVDGDTITDLLWENGTVHRWQSPRIDTPHTHGTGCTLASAIATLLAQGGGMKESVETARHYVLGAIRHAPGFGHGHGPLNHFWNA